MRAGLISFGHGLYYCLGGYTVAIAYNFLNVSDAFLLIAISIILGGLFLIYLGFLLESLEEYFLL